MSSLNPVAAQKEISTTANDATPKLNKRFSPNDELVKIAIALGSGAFFVSLALILSPITFSATVVTALTITSILSLALVVTLVARTLFKNDQKKIDEPKQVTTTTTQTTSNPTKTDSKKSSPKKLSDEEQKELDQKELGQLEKFLDEFPKSTPLANKERATAMHLQKVKTKKKPGLSRNVALSRQTYTSIHRFRQIEEEPEIENGKIEEINKKLIDDKKNKIVTKQEKALNDFFPTESMNSDDDMCSRSTSYSNSRVAFSSRAQNLPDPQPAPPVVASQSAAPKIAMPTFDPRATKHADNVEKLLGANMPVVPLLPHQGDSPLTLNSQFQFMKYEDSVLIAWTISAEMPHDIVRQGGVDVIAVCDKSGSMGGQKMNAQNNALKKVMERLNPRDRFGIVNFGTNTEIGEPIFEVNEKNRKEACARLSQQELGSTYALPGLECAFNAFFTLSEKDAERYVSRPKMIVCTTDGEWGDGSNANAIAPLKQTWEDVDATVSSIGIEVSDNLKGDLKGVADTFGGIYNDATADNLEDIFVELTQTQAVPVFFPEQTGISISSNYKIVKVIDDSAKTPKPHAFENGSHAVGPLALDPILNKNQRTILIQVQGEGDLSVKGICKGRDLITGKPSGLSVVANSSHFPESNAFVESLLDVIQYVETTTNISKRMKEIQLLSPNEEANKKKIFDEVLAIRNEIQTAIISISSPRLIQSLIQMNAATDKYNTLGRITAAIIPRNRLTANSVEHRHVEDITDKLKSFGIFMPCATKEEAQHYITANTHLSFRNLHPIVIAPQFNLVDRFHETTRFPAVVSAIISDYIRTNIVFRYNALSSKHIMAVIEVKPKNEYEKPTTKEEMYLVDNSGQLVKDDEPNKGKKATIEELLQANNFL